MKTPCPGFEIRRTDNGAVIVSPYTILEIDVNAWHATIDVHSGPQVLRGLVSLALLAITPRNAADLVAWMLGNPRAGARMPRHVFPGEPP
ncbi:MAG: hypothetical protein PHQ12_14985, partial [Chthoniobacteraceae bacterium]|nr:hypothetical protein [Chthoniobacteraceae bacterium]